MRKSVNAQTQAVIDVDEAKGLYEDHGWSVDRLAHRYFISSADMRRRLAAVDCDFRTSPQTRTAAAAKRLQFFRDVVRQEFRPTGTTVTGEVYGITVDVLTCGHAVKACFENYIDERGYPERRAVTSKQRTCTSCTNIAAQKGQEI